MIKVNETDELSVSLSQLRISCLLAGCGAELSLKNDTTTSQTPGLTDLNEAVKTTKYKEIEAFCLRLYMVVQRLCCWVTIYT